MLETVREFGLERLEASGETRALRERHASFFLNLVERVAHAAFAFRWAWDTRAGTENLDPMVANLQVEQDHDNVRAALDYLVDTGHAEACLRLTTACVPFWEWYGHLREAEMRLDRALGIAGTEQTAFSAQALLMAGDVAFIMGNLEATSTHARESLAIWRTLDNPRGQAHALHILALIEENKLNWQTATELFEATLEMWRRLDDPISVGSTLCLLGGIAYGQGDLDRAVALEEEAFTLLDAAGDTMWAAMTVWYLGLFAAARGERLEAARRYRSSLATLVGINDAEWLFKPLVGLAAVAAECGQVESSARLLGAVDQILLRTGSRLFPFDRPAYEQADAVAHAALGDERFGDVHRAGGRLTLEELVAEADAVVRFAEEAAREPRRRGATTSSGMTAREGEVLTLLADGKTDREIAELLFVSRRTVNTHVANILSQLGVHSRHDAVVRARELAVLPDKADAPDRHGHRS
jgi:ATP/maltotriose-dependent transcriptional regulator MalT